MLRFPHVPDYKSKQKSVTRTRSVRFGEGYEQRQSDGLNPVLQTWTLAFGRRPKTDADQMDAFFAAHAGVEAFEFELPSSNWSVVAEPFGTGDGATTQFQLRRLRLPGTEALPNAYETCEEFDFNPSLYANGVLQSPLSYSRDNVGLVTFNAAPANGVALTFTGSGTIVRRFKCIEWDVAYVDLDAYDVTATFEEVLG